jgi:hypothetical protein
MHSSSRPRVVGPLEPYVLGFDEKLARLGFTPLSTRGQLELVAHLSGKTLAPDFDAEVIGRTGFYADPQGVASAILQSSACWNRG